MGNGARIGNRFFGLSYGRLTWNSMTTVGSGDETSYIIMIVHVVGFSMGWVMLCVRVRALDTWMWRWQNMLFFFHYYSFLSQLQLLGEDPYYPPPQPPAQLPPNDSWKWGLNKKLLLERCSYMPSEKSSLELIVFMFRSRACVK